MAASMVAQMGTWMAARMAAQMVASTAVPMVVLSAVPMAAYWAGYSVASTDGLMAVLMVAC